jgi:hypothetical protein
MHAPLKQLAKLSLAAAAWSSLVLASGCDTAGSADTRVTEALAQSRAAVRQGGEEAGANARQAIEAVEDATANASAGTRAMAKSALGQLQLDAAAQFHSQAQQVEMHAARMAMDVTLMAGQVATVGTLMAEYQQYDPEPVSNEILKLAQQISGGPGGAIWGVQYPNFSAEFPTVSTLQNESSSLEGEITQRQNQLEQLRQQRGAMIEQAEELARASEAAQGQESVDLFKKAAELRKQAADVAVEMESLAAAIEPLQADKAIADGQAQVLMAASKLLTSQAEQVKQAWDAVRQRVAAQQKLALGIIGAADESVGEATSEAFELGLAQRAARMNELFGRADEMRESALQNARDAAKHFGDAQSAADDLRRQIGERMAAGFQTRPEAEAWRHSRDAVNPAFFQLQQANALRLEGQALADRATTLAVRIELQAMVEDAVQQARAELPGAFQDGNLERQYEETLAQADEAFTQAEEKYQNVISAAGDSSTGRAAAVERIFAFYSRAQIAAVAAQQQEAEKFMGEAAAAVRLAAERNATFPLLPRQLQAMVPPPAPPQEETIDTPAMPAAPTEDQAEPEAPENDAAPQT